MNIKRPEIEIPEYMQSLPMTELGYLKPWFVKADDFRIVDTEKAKLARAKKQCWICGQPFTESRFALVGSSLSALTRVFREPPCHVECAEYAMQVCPFILYPKAKRRVADLEEHQRMEFINKALEIKYDPVNPGEYFIVETDDFRFDEDKEVILCEEYNVINRQYWIEGIRQEKIPDPLVSYANLTEEIKSSITEEEFTKRYLDNKLPSILPIKSHLFVNKRWLKSPNYSFAASSGIISLSLDEIEDAAAFYPLAFINNGEFLDLAVMLGFLPTKNNMVDAEGHWKGSYIPTPIRCHPFRLGNDPGGEKLLCVDCSSGLVIESNSTTSDQESASEGFFVTNGELSAELKNIYKALLGFSNGLTKLRAIISELDSYSLLEAWNIKLTSEDKKQSRNIKGLLKINQNNFELLDAGTRTELKNSGALAVAQIQLDSMKNLKYLAR